MKIYFSTMVVYHLYVTNANKQLSLSYWLTQLTYSSYMARGSWLTGFGSWLVARGSQVLAHGSAHGSYVVHFDLPVCFILARQDVGFPFNLVGLWLSPMHKFGAIWFAFSFVATVFCCTLLVSAILFYPFSVKDV